MTAVRAMAPIERTLIVVTVLVTAAIHVFRAGVDPDIRILFLLNAAGYLVLAAALFAFSQVRLRRAVRWTLLVYTAVTAFLYLLWGALDGTWVVPWGPLKEVAELVLIAVLVRIGRLERPTP